MANSKAEAETPQPEAFWEHCIREMYPGWKHEHYFVPALHVNKTHYVSSSFAGQEVSIPQAPLDAPKVGSGCVLHLSDTRNDSALQRIRHCLQKLAIKQRETMFVISQLDYGDYLRQPCYAAAADSATASASASASATDAAVRLPRAADLKTRDSRGDFDFLILHRKYGIVVAEVKAVGDNWGDLQLSEEQQTAVVLKRVKDAIKQLDKAERVLAHLVSDQNLAPRILKALFLPGVQASIVRKSLGRDPKELRNLGTCLAADPGADPVDLCLCSDHLSDPEIPWHVTDSVLSRVQQWWNARIVSSHEDPNMTDDLYLKILARFCGPATTVKVPWTPLPPLRTTQDAVNFTDTCCSRLTLLPQQVNVLHEAPPRLFACGPPGTGKTVVLLLQAVEWLRQRHEVHVVSTWKYSRAASLRLRAQLLASQAQARKEGEQEDTSITPVNAVSMHEYNFENGLDDVDRAVEELACLAKGTNLCVIADEAGPEGCNEFKLFCEKLLERVSGLRLWAARCRHDCTPDAWRKEFFTQPLRFAPVVKRKVAKSGKFCTGNVRPYSCSNVPSPTDGPPVIHLNHDVVKHTCSSVYDCTQCGDLLAGLLRSDFHIGQTDGSEPCNPAGNNNNNPKQTSSQCPPGLRYQDVVLMYWAFKIKDNSGLINGMRNSGIPVKVATSRDIENVATWQDDVVWAVDGYCVQGLEWKVVVYCSDYGQFDNFTFPSRCTSQLVCFRNKASED